MKRRFRVVSGARDACTLCKTRADAVFVDSYSPKKYRAYVCYECIAQIVEDELGLNKKDEPVEVKEEVKVPSGRKTSKTNKVS